MLATCIGPRTMASARSLMNATAPVVKGVPCFFSDGFSCYLIALLACYHTLTTFARTGKREFRVIGWPMRTEGPGRGKPYSR